MTRVHEELLKVTVLHWVSNNLNTPEDFPSLRLQRTSMKISPNDSSARMAVAQLTEGMAPLA